ncbi:GAF domain-containing SpoIIE family protein phosphatase [Edaphobacter modestus]|uniref:Sigma-B regulation protein RsbU (Phosphoserine phosphatase) n=1 Tax=Edaphobacter modestus TaxID=388466 RepID=A0A4Q7YZT8_9BACT|nr:GAF domain-containing SpoIIE family protein phosphatase [Edaphobacter modestus]RZU42705.1 sigma-B regulation protein RsbU (phosphoserine phosphatase) [Edaphobacter modestus]
MATLPTAVQTRRTIPPSIHSSCEFVQVLMKLQRAANLITSTLDLDALLDRVVNDISSSIGNVEVAVWLRAGDTDDMVLQGVRGCTKHKKGQRLQIGRQGMVGHVAATGKMYYARDVRQDPYYIACEPATRSEVSIPLKAAGMVIGVLSVDHRQIDAFSDDQLTVLQALAGHIAIAIENARLFRVERLQRERMQQESDEARAIQQALFLKPVPLIPGFAFETAWHPAGAVAGDWFDFIDLGDQRYGIALADVSGKGMSAALLMSATRAILRSIAPLYSSPEKTLEHLNRTLMEDFPAGKFVTMVYGVLDAGSRELTLASAGHLRPLLINHDCSFLELDTGLPLGLGVSSYPQCILTLNPGTQLLLYTDGITEAMDKTEEEYGPARLIEHFLRPEACVDGLIAEVQRFGAGSDRTDDATAVLIRSR